MQIKQVKYIYYMQNMHIKILAIKTNINEKDKMQKFQIF